MQIRVYYEDTDCGGVVYYANYLRFLERARTEFLRDRGIDVADFAGRGIVFVVTRVDLSYRSPARYNDLLDVETAVKEMTRTTFTLSHAIRRHDTGRIVAEGEITLACINARGKPDRLPDGVAKVLEDARAPGIP
jgi:acyl-CoA thioester hydrolase